MPAGRVGDGAGGRSACSCCPASASAPATRQGLRPPVRVGDGAGHWLGLLVLPGRGQRPRHPGQGLRLLVRVGDGAGHCLSLPGDGSGLLVLPGPASAPATRASAAPAGPGR